MANPNYFAIGGISALVGFGLTYLYQKQKEAKESRNGSPSKQKGESPDKTKKRTLKKQKSENRFLEGKNDRISS